MNPPAQFYEVLDTPVGPLEIRATEVGVTAVCFNADLSSKPNPNIISNVARKQLDLYFKGRLETFTVPLAALGTAFETSVWDELIAIPFAETTSYGSIATKLGKPGAMRAVGLANGKNPIAIIVPCHRVIGSNGKLTGYGGELWRKQWLLQHEARVAGKILL